ncbi:MAG TPA: hypothetical protein VJR06_09590 [Nitrososphaerales archaeon]|nr:hypothetical protein [Nitrososphaerales archaeon]
MALGKNTKAAVDLALGLIGALLAYFAANATSFGADAPYIALVGVVGGYAVSDILTFVDTGQLPTAAQVQTQASTAWVQAKPLIQAEMAKQNLSATDQATLTLLLAFIDQKLGTTA